MPEPSLVAIIAGAVGHLGLATAQALQQAGHRSVLVDRSADRLRGRFQRIANSPDRLPERFPQDRAMIDLGTASYRGVPLISSESRVSRSLRGFTATGFRGKPRKAEGRDCRDS